MRDAVPVDVCVADVSIAPHMRRMRAAVPCKLQITLHKNSQLFGLPHRRTSYVLRVRVCVALCAPPPCSRVLSPVQSGVRLGADERRSQSSESHRREHGVQRRVCVAHIAHWPVLARGSRQKSRVQLHRVQEQTGQIQQCAVYMCVTVW